MRTHVKEASKSGLLAHCEKNSPVTVEFYAQIYSYVVFRPFMMLTNNR